MKKKKNPFYVPFQLKTHTFICTKKTRSMALIKKCKYMLMTRTFARAADKCLLTFRIRLV